MKFYKVLLLVCLLASVHGYSKSRETKKGITIDDRIVKISDYKNDTLRAYFDTDLKKTSSADRAMFSTIAYKVADGWVCRDYGAFDSKLYFIAKYRDQELKIKEGGYAQFYSNGNVHELGQYLNNKKNGRWITFEYDGSPVDTINYLNGIEFGKNSIYSVEGKLTQTSIIDSTGKGNITSFYEDGNIRMKGQFASGMKKDSTWTSYFQNGKVSYIEIFEKDSLISNSCFDINGVSLANCIAERAPEYPGGTFKLKEYLNDAIRLPANMHIISTQKNVVQFLIDENGRPINIRIIVSANPELDNITIEVIKKMKTWKPAIDHNQPIKVKYTLPITFQREY